MPQIAQIKRIFFHADLADYRFKLKANLPESA